jgi:hypothetical protein
MSSRTPWLVLAALPLVASFAIAQNKDAVDLLPAETPACLELRQPTRLAREINLLVKGSALDDLPERMAKMREKAGAPGYLAYRQRDQLSMLSVFLCPEMLDEAGRARGGFIALTGFAKDDMPHVAGLLQSGTSTFPGIMMRAFLTSSMARKVGEIEGVPFYREQMRIYRKMAPGDAGPGFEERDIGPVVGRLPGVVLMGSSVEAFNGVIRRAKGKSVEASLIGLRAFKDAAALRERPGLFAYLDMAAMQAKISELGGRPGNPDARFSNGFSALLGKDALRNLTLSLTLQGGALEGRVRCDLNAGSDSPLLGLLPDRAAPRELLYFAPNDSFLAMAGGIGDGEKQLKTLLNILDTFYGIDGRPGNNRPSRAIAEMEKKLDLHIDKDVVAPLAGVGFVVAKDWQVKPGQGILLLLQARDEAAAGKLESEGLPRLLSLGEDNKVKPIESEIGGHSIKSVPGGSGKRLPFNLHFGRRGSVVVVGLDSERVAAAVEAGAKKKGLLGETKIAEAVKTIDEKSLVVGVFSPTQAALDLLAVLNQPPNMRMPERMKGPPPPGVQQPKPPEFRPLKETKTVQAFREAGEPFVFGMTRQPESLTLEMRPLSLRKMMPRLLDVWIESILTNAGNAAGIELGVGDW